MATLNINGKRVKVDDAFVSMTPEQQNATVEEIAGSLGAAAQAPASGGEPSPALSDALAGASQRSTQFFKPVAPSAPAGPDLAGATAATLGGLVNGIPVIGPIAQNVTDAMMGAGAQLTGGDYAATVRGLQERRGQLAEANPVADIAGNLAGGVGAFGAASKVPAMADALGMTGGLLPRFGNSLASGAAIGAGDAAVRGGDLADMAEGGAIGGLVGGAIPIAGAVIKAATAPVVRGVQSLVRGAASPEREGARAVGAAIQRDAANPAVPLLTQADEAAARLNGQPLLNIDRGGETTLAAMRSAANQNPTARATVQKMADDRFAAQSQRAAGFFNRIMGGKVEDLTRKAEINSQARAMNGKNYDAAYASPAAQAVFSRDLQELMQSPAIQRAISGVKETAGDEAALAGIKPVRNPFRMSSDGTWKLVQKADGSVAIPNLQFWDQVQRNLRRQIDAVKPGSEDAGRLGRLRTKLLGALDSQVDEFKAARTGAAGFFGAENAVDAGRAAFAAPKAIDESLAALRSMSKADREDFGIGMVSQAMDDVRAGNNRTNMTRMFDNDARKALMRETMGQEKYDAFQQFIRIEDSMDRVRGALGNSTTARQLAEMGIAGELRQTGGQGALGGIAGFAASGGNLSTAATMAILTAAGRHGLRFARSGVDGKVMEQMARLLASGKPNELQLAMTLASQDAAHAAALEAIDKGIGIATRGSGQAAVNQ